MLEKRTSTKSESKKAVRRMISMKIDSWTKADGMADAKGTTRSAVVAEAIETLWRAYRKSEQQGVQE